MDTIQPQSSSTCLTLTCTSSPSTQWFSSLLQGPIMLSQPIMLLSICIPHSHTTITLDSQEHCSIALAAVFWDKHDMPGLQTKHGHTDFHWSTQAAHLAVLLDAHTPHDDTVAQTNTFSNLTALPNADIRTNQAPLADLC